MSTPIQPLTYEKDAVTELLAIDGSLLLRIRRDAIQRLRRLIYEGVRAIPQQPGLEFGGLCVASKPVSWGLTETVIDFVPVEIQYQYGPRFRACPADGPIFKEALAEQQRDGESRVVGCFRSHLAADLQIRKEDRWLMNLLLGERGGFLMLVQPMFDEVSVFSFGAGGTPLDTLPITRFSLRDGGPEEKPKRPELPSTAADPPFASIKAASGALAINRAPAVLAGSGNGNPAVPGMFLIRRRLRREAKLRPARLGNLKRISGMWRSRCCSSHLPCSSSPAAAIQPCPRRAWRSRPKELPSKSHGTYPVRLSKEPYAAHCSPLTTSTLPR